MSKPMFPTTSTVPRYMRAVDKSVVRLWGAPIIHKGRKP